MADEQFIALDQMHDVTCETCPPVRWNDGVLEYSCTITTYRAGAPISMSVEWRPVPTEVLP